MKGGEKRWKLMKKKVSNLEKIKKNENDGEK